MISCADKKNTNVKLDNRRKKNLAAANVCLKQSIRLFKQSNLKHLMRCSLQSDRSREGDGVSILSISSCGQWGGHDVAGPIADQDEEVMTWTTLNRYIDNSVLSKWKTITFV